MHPLLLAWLFLFSTAAAAGTPIVGFDQDSYALAWANVKDNVISNEYVRAGETVDHWERMLTFKEYTGAQHIKDVLPGYMASVKPLLAQKAKVFEKEDSRHTEEITVVLALLAPDKSHYEYVVHRLVADAKRPVRSMIFSLRIPYSESLDLSQIEKNKNKWMTGLEEVNPELYKTLPGNLSKHSPAKHTH